MRLVQVSDIKNLNENRSSSFLEDVIEFLSDHREAFNEFKREFNPKVNEFDEVITDGLDESEVQSWLETHEQLYDDYSSYLGKKRNNTLSDKAISEKAESNNNDEDIIRKIADNVYYNGPEYRGAAMPAPLDKYFNEINIPDNMRLKWFDIYHDANMIIIDYVTQEDFSTEDSEIWLDELKRVFNTLASKYSAPAFEVQYEVRCRDGREYGYAFGMFKVNTSLAENKRIKRHSIKTNAGDVEKGTKHFNNSTSLSEDTDTNQIIDIRKSLNDIDWENDMQLRNLYDSLTISEEQKIKLVELIQANNIQELSDYLYSLSDSEFDSSEQSFSKNDDVIDELLFMTTSGSFDSSDLDEMKTLASKLRDRGFEVVFSETPIKTQYHIEYWKED